MEEACKVVRFALDESYFAGTGALFPGAEVAKTRAGVDAGYLLVVEKDLPVITGLEVARLAHNLNPLLPILFVGSPSSMDLEKEAANLGVVDYVEESIDADQLSRRLKMLLNPGFEQPPIPLFPLA